MATDKTYEDGLRDGAQAASLDLVNCSAHHASECDCRTCDYVRWIIDGIKPDWVTFVEEGDR